MGVPLPPGVQHSADAFLKALPAEDEFTEAHPFGETRGWGAVFVVVADAHKMVAEVRQLLVAPVTEIQLKRPDASGISQLIELWEPTRPVGNKPRLPRFDGTHTTPIDWRLVVKNPDGTKTPIGIINWDAPWSFQSALAEGDRILPGGERYQKGDKRIVVDTFNTYIRVSCDNPPSEATTTTAIFRIDWGVVKQILINGGTLDSTAFISLIRLAATSTHAPRRRSVCRCGMSSGCPLAGRFSRVCGKTGSGPSLNYAPSIRSHSVARDSNNVCSSRYMAR
jgi:hypothetical protein